MITSYLKQILSKFQVEGFTNVSEVLWNFRYVQTIDVIEVKFKMMSGFKINILNIL